MNEWFSLASDIATYTFSNADENNHTVTIKSVTKKIVANKDIPYVSIYEAYPDETPITSLIFRSAHSTEIEHNRIFLYEGTLKGGNIIPINFLLKSNSTDDLSYTLIDYQTENSIDPNKDIEQTNKKDPKTISFDDIELKEKENHLPSVILAILILIFFLLVLGSLLNKNRVAEGLEQYRRRINNLKRNVIEKKKKK